MRSLVRVQSPRLSKARFGLLMQMEMKAAIGTSLAIIAGNALLGFFLGDVSTLNIDWPFLLGFTGLAMIGLFIGTFLNNNLDGAKLKFGFGIFVLLMSFFIFIMEFAVISH